MAYLGTIINFFEAENDKIGISLYNCYIKANNDEEALKILDGKKSSIFPNSLKMLTDVVREESIEWM